jgi:hypothetical protein
MQQGSRQQRRRLASRAELSGGVPGAGCAALAASACSMPRLAVTLASAMWLSVVSAADRQAVLVTEEGVAMFMLHTCLRKAFMRQDP